MSALAIDLEQLADMHVLYRFFDAGGRLIYVGMTSDFGKRLTDHADKAWFLAVAAISIERFPSYAEAAVAEDRAISTEHPLKNKVGLSKEEASRRAQMKKLQLSSERVRAAEEKQLLLAEEKRLAREERERLILEQPPRDLLADLDSMLGTERVKLRDAIGLLRNLAPEWEVYRRMTAVRLREELKLRGVRVINTSGTPWLNPADLRRVQQVAVQK